jgi:hypothetical protein
MKSGTGILPVGLGGIGILPMIHGLEGDPQAHATLNRVFIHVLRDHLAGGPTGPIRVGR